MALAKAPAVGWGPSIGNAEMAFLCLGCSVRESSVLGRVEEFPVMHRLRRLEDKMFLPVQSPPCSRLSAIFARVPRFIELHVDMLLFLGPAGTPKTPASALAG